MKGWMDRVLSQGFAFSLEKMYDNGIFKVCLSRAEKKITKKNKTTYIISVLLCLFNLQMQTYTDMLVSDLNNKKEMHINMLVNHGGNLM